MVRAILAVLMVGGTLSVGSGCHLWVRDDGCGHERRTYHESRRHDDRCDRGYEGARGHREVRVVRVYH